MIEGARVHPSYTDAQRNGRVPKDCETCKATQTVTTRQHMGCAYLPRVDDARPWMPPSWRDRRDPEPLSTCPGYSIALPAVVDVVLAFPQWKTGTLTAYLDGEEPTRGALEVLSVYEVGVEEWKGEKTKESLDAARSKP